MGNAGKDTTKRRLNLSIDLKDFALMESQMHQLGFKTITDFIVFRCTHLEVKNDSDKFLELELKHLNQECERLNFELNETKSKLDQAQNTIQSALLYKMLPFWKRLKHTLELPNNK